MAIGLKDLDKTKKQTNAKLTTENNKQVKKIYAREIFSEEREHNLDTEKETKSPILEETTDFKESENPEHVRPEHARPEHARLERVRPWETYDKYHGKPRTFRANEAVISARRRVAEETTEQIPDYTESITYPLAVNKSHILWNPFFTSQKGIFNFIAYLFSRLL